MESGHGERGLGLAAGVIVMVATDRVTRVCRVSGIVTVDVDVLD